MKAHSMWASVMFVGGLVLVFIGERVVGAGTARMVLSWLGALAAVAALGLRLARMMNSAHERKEIEQAFVVLYALGALALVLYGVQSDAWSRVAAKALDQSSPKLAVALAAFWPALMLASLLPVVLGEISFASMSRAPVVEAPRVKDAMLTGAGLAGALIFAFAIAYVADRRDVKWDLSYFRTARPGEATHRVVASLDEPVDVSVFFPPSNEVRDEVAEYLTDLSKENRLFQVAFYDQAVDLAKAKELGVNSNGAVVVQRKTRKEQLNLGLDLESARAQLSRFDAEFQKRLLQTVKTKRTIYLVGGHGERSEDRGNAPDARGTVRAFKELLTSQNYDVRPLTTAEGLANEVPKDAAAVALLGPQTALMQEETEALRQYLDRGGRMFIALDPESNFELDGVLSRLGLKFVPTVLANDVAFVRMTHQVTDHQLIGTTNVSSHPSVNTISRLGPHDALIFPASGWLDDRKDKPQDVIVDFTVHARPDTFDDLNNNYQFDAPAEQRKAWNLAAAVTGRKVNVKPEEQLRAVVITSSGALTDLYLENARANAFLAVDSMKWLLGEESTAGEISSEEDKPIEHTRKQDVFWFYSTIFVAPAAVLGVGWTVNRRRGRKAARSGGAS